MERINRKFADFKADAPEFIPTHKSDAPEFIPSFQIDTPETMSGFRVDAPVFTPSFYMPGNLQESNEEAVPEAEACDEMYGALDVPDEIGSYIREIASYADEGGLCV